jgi:hypothetical protein
MIPIRAAPQERVESRHTPAPSRKPMSPGFAGRSLRPFPCPGATKRPRRSSKAAGPPRTEAGNSRFPHQASRVQRSPITPLAHSGALRRSPQHRRSASAATAENHGERCGSWSDVAVDVADQRLGWLSRAASLVHGHRHADDETWNYLLRPSTKFVGIFCRSTPSRQRTLIATISVPSGPLPRANERTPQFVQNKWWMTFLLN